MKLFSFDPNIKIVENDEINLLNLWKVIWGGRWFIILVTFSAAVLSALYTPKLRDFNLVIVGLLSTSHPPIWFTACI